MQFYCAGAGRRIDLEECGSFDPCTDDCELKKLRINPATTLPPEPAASQQSERQCCRCGEWKPLDADHFHRKGHGWFAACKICKNKRQAELRAKLKEQSKEAPVIQRNAKGGYLPSFGKKAREIEQSGQSHADMAEFQASQPTCREHRRLEVDFEDYPELYERLQDQAKAEIRPPELQILHMIKSMM